MPKSESSKPQSLAIRFKKSADGRSSLSCTRPDGSTTWQTLDGQQAAFFPRHDLTHYAVETVLGHKQGFYGLLAAGWDISDFGKPEARRKIPTDAVLAEMTVGLLDLERATGERVQANDVNTRLREWCAENGLPEPAEISEDDLGQIRKRRAELFSSWEAVAPGEVLELSFETAPSP
jgi:hypothetical protein